MKGFFLAGLATLMMAAFKCDELPQAPTSAQAEGDGPAKRDLRMAFRRAGAVGVVYSTAEPALIAQYEALIDSFKVSMEGRLPVVSIPDDALTPQQARQFPLILMGRNFKSAILDTLLARLPLRLRAAEWAFDGKIYRSPGVSFKLNQYPNPLNDSMPVTVFTGNSGEALVSLLKMQQTGGGFSLFFGGWGYEIYDKGEVIGMGEFQDRNWAIDRTSQRDFSHLRDTIARSSHFSFVNCGAGLPADELEKLKSACEQNIERIRIFTNGITPLPHIKYYLYGSAEDKGLRLRDMRPAQANVKENEVYVVAGPPFNGHHLAPENYLALNAWLGPPSKRFLEEGLAIHFTGGWHEKGYEYWAQRLFQSGNLPAVTEMLNDEEFQRESPLVMGCAAASFTAYLLNAWGKKMLLEQYKAWKDLSKQEIAGLQSGWSAWLAGKSKAAPQVYSTKLASLKGFNFAHEGYQVFNGYGSRLAEASLHKLRSLGANTVALVPYGFMRDPDKPGFIGVDHGAGGENDESVVQSAYYARQKGLTTVLKPQIWVSRGWPGDVQMTHEADWKLFFDYYYRWIRHYALMAEMEQMDVFCLGVEFAKATLSHPEEWKAIIRKIRGIYSGPLTYAANWGEEFEKLTFWGELDYIGLDCYYPLSEKEMPEKSELVTAFANVLQKVEKISRQYNKPIIFTEIGFRSVATPWRNPHAERDGRPLDEHAQNLCYEVVFEGLRAKPWVAGVLWWKWPSYLDHNGDDGGCFTPNNKVAEVALKKWFASREDF